MKNEEAILDGEGGKSRQEGHVLNRGEVGSLGGIPNGVTLSAGCDGVNSLPFDMV